MATSNSEGGMLTRGVLAEYAKERLLQRIMDGSYPPDSRIVETRVAREFGTSQAPIREALRGLEALGVVEITPFRGTRVRQPDLHELVEAYVVRTDLEVLGARLGISRITDPDLNDLCDLAKQMREAAGAGDRHAVATADAGFHGRLIQLAGNATLKRLWSSLEPFSRTYITLVVPGSDLLWSAHLHDPILEALQRRDQAAVVRALRHHFRDARTMLSRLWAEQQSAAIKNSSDVGPGHDLGGKGKNAPRGPGRAKP
jgi:DNA-binding GntR family transcriptional regulator